MEMALVNTVAPGERLLVVSHGFFGNRFPAIAKAFGIECDVLDCPWGERVSPEKIAQTLDSKNYKAMTVTHVDTSTSVMADIEATSKVMKGRDTLWILDGVCATGGIREDMDKYGIDVILTGSQKAIAVPPGLCFLAVGPRAVAARKAIAHAPAYYADIENWRPVMENPSKYFATPAVNMVYGLDAGIGIIEKEGLEKRFDRHIKYGRGVRSALRSMGFKPLAAEEASAHTMTTAFYPEGIDDAKFRMFMFDKGINVAAALGPVAGKAFRIGHMGNTTPDQLKRAIRTIAEALSDQGVKVDAEKALETLGL
jgi:aspartate aminotransferase-like enzyme